MSTKVAINGLGRIGRAILKLVIDQPELELVAVNDLAEIENLAYLLRFDTVYGRYSKSVTVDGGHLVVAGRKLRTLRNRDPAELPWKELGIELVFECTGALRRREDLERHIRAGARFVILSAPSQGGEVETVVHGANVSKGAPSIISCASCTTNCITPVVEIIGRRIGFRKAMMTTVHAYTSSQSVIDGPSKNFRRGRAAAANLVPATTGGTIDNPDIRFSILNRNSASVTHVGASSALRRILGIDVDPAPLQRLADDERTIRATAIALRGMRPPRFPSLFETFASVVPFQQLSLEAGAAIVARLVAKFGKHLEHDRRRFYAFPTSRAIAATRLDALRACGLSAKKAQTLRGLARAVESGVVNEERLAAMSTSAAFQKLIELPGIGPWSAGVVLLRGLGHLDVFPSGDVGAARGLRTLMRLGPHAPLDRVIEHFGEHRGYLYFCALGGWLLKKGLVHPAPEKGRGTRVATKR